MLKKNLMLRKLSRGNSFKMQKVIIWNVKEIAEKIKERIANNFDANIIVTGGTGKGKSTLIYQLLEEFDDFKIKDKLTYDRTEIIHLIKDFKKSYIWADEMVSAGFKRNFFEREQISLIQTLTQYRSNQNVFICALPIFWTLDKELLKLFCIHINVVSRGVAVVHLPKAGRLFSDDLWDVKTNQKLEDSWSKKMQKNPNYKPPLSKYTTFYGYIFFGALSDHKEEYYNRLKEERRAKVEGDKKEEVKEDFFKKVLTSLREKKLDEQGLLQICNFYGKNLIAVKTRLRQLIQNDGSKEKLADLIIKTENKTKTAGLHNNHRPDPNQIPTNDL